MIALVSVLAAAWIAPAADAQITLSNDDWQTAFPLTIGASPRTSESNTSATVQFGEPPGAGCFSNPPQKTLWYRVTGTGGGIAVDTRGSNFDTVLQVFHASSNPTDANRVPSRGPNATQGCDDDGAGVTAGPSLVRFNSVAGQTYLIQVGGYGGASPNPTSGNVSIVARPIPANDDAPDAQTITRGQDVSGTTFAADGLRAAGTNCPAPSNPAGRTADVWYRYTPTQPGRTTFTAQGRPLVLAIHTRRADGYGTSATPTACVVGNSNSTSLSVDLPAGDYIVEVGSEPLFNNEGSFTLTTAFDPDSDGDGSIDSVDADDDGDGVNDPQDAFRLDPAEHADLDNDGVGDNSDPDVDGDGVANAQDRFPRNAGESADFDNDGLGDNADPDDDGDGVNDPQDAFPRDAAEQSDLDRDGIGDNSDPDVDGDGAANAQDRFPRSESETDDADNDGTGDRSDADDDNDGVLDVVDSFPRDSRESADHDRDGNGDNGDTDDDNDGVPDGDDRFPRDAAESADTDRDGIGDNSDSDDDNDRRSDAEEAAAGSDPRDQDTDDDGLSDNTERRGTSAVKFDTDGDGISDGVETGIVRAVADPGGIKGTDAARFKPDKDPRSRTNPRKKDTDGDKLADGREDKNRDGAKGKRESDPRKKDTDGDRIPDGKDRKPLKRSAR